MMLSLNLMVLDQPSRERVNGQVTGLGVSTGRYEGRARLVRGAQDFEKIVKGDVLVAGRRLPTTSYYLCLAQSSPTAARRYPTRRSSPVSSAFPPW